MTGRLTQIWRHPIKGHGREQLNNVELTQGKTLPWDRHWAVAHADAKISSEPTHEWAACANFSRAAKAPSLMALTSELNVETGQITLSHPDLGQFTFDPETEGQAFVDWAGGLIPQTRSPSARIVRSQDNGFTDSDFPSLSILNMSSHRAVSQKLGTDLAITRWRGNLVVDGLGPWEEFEWIGRTVRIGAAEIEIRERITRCLATTANPDTGIRDADTLGALNDGWGHQEFGVYGVVTKSGPINIDDSVEVL